LAFKTLINHVSEMQDFSWPMSDQHCSRILLSTKNISWILLRSYIQFWERLFFNSALSYTTTFAWHLTDIPILAFTSLHFLKAEAAKTQPAASYSISWKTAILTWHLTLLFSQRSLKLWDEFKHLCQQRNWWKVSPQKKKLKTM